MSYPKVLVGVVTYEGKDYVWDKVYKNLQNLSYPNYDILVVDNTKDMKYYEKLKKQGVNVVHTKRGKTSREALTVSQNYIRDVVLNEGYDYLMFIESDLVPPRDIIERLMSHNRLVVGSMYYIGHHWSKKEPPRPCLFETVKRGDTTRTENINPVRGWDYFGNGLQLIHGCGFGSTLIKREILEKFKFWYTLEPPIKHSDVLFYMDLHNAGYRAYVDTDIIVPHYNSNWGDVKDI